MANYTVREVKTSSDEAEFLNMAYKIYEGCDNWVAPLHTDIKSVFDRKKNKMFVGGDATRFLAYDNNNKCVGRIAAFYNTSLIKEGEMKVGGCGFFEAINSKELAHLLFDTAKEWLLSKGMEAMDGPINFGDREMWWGLLTDGFIFPNYGMNYNYPYYKELFESYGFMNYFEGYSFYRDFDSSTLNPVLLEKARRLRENPAYKFENIKNKDLNEVAKNFCNIYRKAWAKFDVAEITDEDSQKLIKKLGPIIDRNLIYFAYYNGEAIGFFITIPDINTVIKPLKGKMGFFNTIRFLYRLKVKKVARNAMSLIFGVVPEHQGKGIESGIIDCFRAESEKGNIHYDSLSLAWVGDFNPLMIRMVEKYVGATRNKTHTTFRYIFDRDIPFERAPKVSISRG